MKHLFIATLFFVLPFVGQAQNYELSFGLGGSLYFGDLNTVSFQKNTTLTKFAAELSMGYQVNDHLNTRFSLLYAGIEGDDAIALSEKRKERNLHAESIFLDFSLQGEYYIFGFDYYEEGKFFSPYLLGGISAFYFDPKTQYDGKNVRLRPLGTEGQGIGDAKKYSLIQGSLIAGAGAKLILSKKISLGFELSMRFTTTDYLDDVSTVYASYEDVLEENGVIAANLSQRIDEYNNKEEGSFPGNYIGASRGNPDVKDFVMVGLLKLHYNLGRTLFKTVDCPRF